ncbi:MAG: ATP-binding cassette domain-containing protein [Tissierellales bacterium]|nr:ATP-binding cassette domain-containing protein [Tissierellales bacterium]
MKNILEIKNISKSFTLHNINKHIKACNDISLSIRKGEFIGITGKSGSGKSTILKSIYRTYLPEKGNILYDSEKFGEVNLRKGSFNFWKKIQYKYFYRILYKK